MSSSISKIKDLRWAEKQGQGHQCDSLPMHEVVGNDKNLLNR